MNFSLEIDQPALFLFYIFILFLGAPWGSRCYRAQAIENRRTTQAAGSA
jgi:hypothetical protein